jgi:hypothetical protein
MLDSVMYAMTGTRPDICFAVGMLRRCAYDPSDTHMTAMKRLLRHLAGTVDWKLGIGGPSHGFGPKDDGSEFIHMYVR